MLQTVRALVLAILTFPLVACGQPSTVQVDGISFTKQTFSAPDGQKEAVVGDLTGDGHLDVLLTVRDSISILRGDGAGTLVAHDHFSAGPNTTGPALADLNGDGHVDIAVANHDTHFVSFLQGDGTGGFQSFSASPLTIDVDPHPHAVRAADLDGDGHPDLIVDHREARGLLVLRGRGDGTFASPGTVVDAGGDPYRGMAVGDLNGDGALDLVTPNPSAVGVLLNTNPNQLTFAQSTLGTDAGPFAVNLADLNGDEHLDVIAALDEGSSLVQVFLGDGQGSFREADASPFRLAAGGKMIARGDFNGDGVDDAAITCWNTTEVLLLLGGADAIRTSTVPAQGNPWGPAAGDLNGDGIADLVVPDASSDHVVTFVSHDE